jgi:hypothetical protein
MFDANLNNVIPAGEESLIGADNSDTCLSISDPEAVVH